MIRAVVIAIAMLAACDRASDNDESFQEAARTLDEVERVEQRDQQRISDLSATAALLRSQVRQLTDGWTRINAELGVATAAYERARVIGERARDEFNDASKKYAQAARAFRTVATIIIIAAVSDALGNQICAETTSTHAFRKKLRAEGISLDGLDVDHVWPRALGGADHPLNYQLLDSSLNRSLGAGVMDKIANEPLATLQGLVVSAFVSLRCG